MAEIGPSFAELENELKGKKLGVIPCEISVNFQVAATGQDKTSIGAGQNVAETSALVVTTTDVKLGYEGNAESKKGNTIAIKLTHIACLSKDTVGGNPSALRDLDDFLKGRYVVYSAVPR